MISINYQVNMDGTALFVTVASIFIAQVIGFESVIGQFCIFVFLYFFLYFVFLIGHLGCNGSCQILFCDFFRAAG